MDRDAKIYVAGHGGMVGAAVVRRLRKLGFGNLLTRRRSELDLTRQAETEAFFEAERPDAVVMAAAKVGGIHANAAYPADFIHDNLAMATNAIRAAHRVGTPRLLFLGSSCIYPKLAPQPIREESLLTGPLEPTNEAYAVAKIAGIKLCQHFRSQYGVAYHSLMPTNLYGPGDNYHPENAHLLPALLRRFHEAKESDATRVAVWGTGKPRRELMHADDLADAVAFALSLEDPPNLMNAGTGVDHSIAEIAEMAKAAVGYKGEIFFDASKPDGAPRKLLDSSRLRQAGWQPRIPIEKGIPATYERFLEELSKRELRAK